MIEYLMSVGGLISGALIYLATYDSVKEHMDVQLDKNLLFPIFVIIVLILGVYITETIQLNENAARNSNGQQKVSIYTCLTENTSQCSALVNNLNNDNYSQFTAGKIQTMNLYIGFSLVDTIIRNVFTYFCIGLLFTWASISLYSFRKVMA